MNREVFESAFVEIWKGANFFVFIGNSWLDAANRLQGIATLSKKAGPFYADIYADIRFLKMIALERSKQKEYS